MVSPCATDGPKGSVGSFWGKKRHLHTQISPSVPSLFQPSLSSSCDGDLYLTGTEKNVEIGGELREIRHLADPMVTSILVSSDVQFPLLVVPTDHLVDHP
eukprot:scaffold8048_cov155-Amphora_coffeaeformis.AAC.1